MTPRRGGVVVPALAAGVLLALSVPPFGAWPLAFVGAALLYWRLRGLRLRARFLAGWVAGVGCFAIGLFWAQSFNWYGWVVLVVIEALFGAVAAAATPPVSGRIPAFVGAATLLEAARQSWPFGGLPVGGVFLGQAGGPLLGLARLGGPLLMTAAVWAGGAALGELVPWAWSWRARQHPAWSWSGAVTVGLIVAVALAAVLSPDGGAAVRALRVAAVQGGGPRGFTELETGRAGDFAAQLEASSSLRLARPRPALVVWPEDVIAIGVPLTRSVKVAQASELAESLGATVLAGVTITEPGGVFRNQIVALGPSGRVISVFEKVHRVPFGEFVPFRGFFSHLASLAAVPRDAIPGHGSGLMTTSAGPIGVLVSFEVFFSERGRSSVAAGARLLVVPTNTSSYGTVQMPSQEVAASQVQAVSQGRDLVQAAPTGFSAFVTNDGAVLQQSGLSERRVLVGTVALRVGATIYQQTGDLPVLALAALGLIAGISAEMRRRRGGGDARSASASEDTVSAGPRRGPASALDRGTGGPADPLGPAGSPAHDRGGAERRGLLETLGAVVGRHGSGLFDPPVAP